MKLRILVNNEEVDALSSICHKDQAEYRGRATIQSLRKEIPRHLFEIPIQAAVESGIIAREHIAALRKDDSPKCYGGDVTRKRKLWASPTTPRASLGPSLSRSSTWIRTLRGGMFDSNEELLARIRLGEDSLLELRSVRWKGARIAAPSRDDLADELAAFANATDGVLVLGVDDTRKIEGIPLERLDDVEELVREVCQDSIKPPLLVYIVRRLLPGAKGEERAVLQVTIPRSGNVHLSPGGYLRREGSSKREFGPEELAPEVLARLMQQRSRARAIRFDEQAVPGTSPDSLAEPLWTRFRGEAEEERLVTLDKLKVVTRDDQLAWRATVAGLLMCTEHPEEWLPNAVVAAVHYGTGERDSHHKIDARTITGPLDRQVSEALFFVERNMSVAAVKAPGRIDIPQYSLRAVFEAIVNAVAHRDYSILGSRTRLFLFPDRLELYSPGGLANTLTVESLALRQSTRNEIVASLLAKCPVQSRSDLGRARIMDRRGEGVPIIVRESRKLSGRSPEYLLVDDSELRLTIYAAKPPVRGT